MAEAICSRIARMVVQPAIKDIVSIRDKVSRGLLEWAVVIEPSLACIHRLKHIQSSLIAVSPNEIRSVSCARHFLQITDGHFTLTSIFDGVIPNNQMLLPLLKSAAFSIVNNPLIRWCEPERTFKQVVLPETVPQIITI